MIDAANLLARARQIRLLALDVDGVMTDGSIVLTGSGDEIKSFDVRDGFGLRCWTHHGFAAAAITGRATTAVENRCRDLGFRIVLQGERDKGPAFDRMLRATGFTAAETAAMGDDVPDLPMLLAAALATCPADAAQAVRERVDWIAPNPGGKGAVRALVEMLLEAKGLWSQTIDHYARLASSRKE